MTITLTREEAQQVLDALDHQAKIFPVRKAIDVLRARLAQPEPPVLNGIDCSCGRKWRVAGGVIIASGMPEPEPVAWQPIDTAPKDGTNILVCCAVDADGTQIKSHGLFTQRAAWWGEEGWVVYCDLIQEPQCFFEPTHWMPVPPLYTAPPQHKEWQGLTDEEIKKEQHHIDWTNVHTYAKFARAIEAKLKEKNT